MTVISKEDFVRFDDCTQVTVFFMIAKKVFGRHLEFFACHVTEALCVTYQILWNLIMNRKVVMKQHNWSDGLGVILKRLLFVGLPLDAILIFLRVT